MQKIKLTSFPHRISYVRNELTLIYFIGSGTTFLRFSSNEFGPLDNDK